MESSVFLATVRFRRAEARTVICTVQLRAVLSCPGPPCSKGPPAVDPFDSGTVEAKQAIEPHVNQGLRLAIPKRGRGDKGKKKKKNVSDAGQLAGRVCKSNCDYQSE